MISEVNVDIEILGFHGREQGLERSLTLTPQITE